MLANSAYTRGENLVAKRFDKSALIYDDATDSYHCTAGHPLARRRWLLERENTVETAPSLIWAWQITIIVYNAQAVTA